MRIFYYNKLCSKVIKRISSGIIMSLLTTFTCFSQTQENDSTFSQIETTVVSKNEIPSSIYDRPYSFWENNPDYKRLAWNSGITFGASFVAAGLLYIMPEGVSNWDRDEISINSVFSDWWKHVCAGPVVDKDDWQLNYLAHPYVGTIYYMGARSAGVSAPYSFLYSVAFSTFFWEYGVEALAEIPSVQDLIVTPVCGSILGEAFYLTKREIVARDYRLLGTPILGHTVTFLMDPLNEVMDLCTGKFKKKKNNSNLYLYSSPTRHFSGNISYNITLNIKF